MIHFCKIMIFTGQPENRHMRMARRGSLARQRNRGSSLMRSKERPAKHANLLARNHDVGSLAQPLQPGRQRRRRILPSQQSHQLISLLARMRQPCPLPAAVSGNSPIPAAHRRLSCAIIQEDPGQPRHHGDRETLSVQFAFSRLHGAVQSRRSSLSLMLGRNTSLTDAAAIHSDAAKM